MSSKFTQHSGEHANSGAHAPAGTHSHRYHRDAAHDEALADLLDLDAAVLGSWQEDVLSWLESFLPAAPGHIIDLGAGTGSGTLALAHHFPEADLTAVDRSAVMLQRLETAVAGDGLASRVGAVRADLDEGWPALRPADVVWAASFLHEVADPARVIWDLGGTLQPGGLVLVAEIASLPRFLPDDVGLGRLGLEARCHEELREIGWNAHPDWREPLEQSGLVLVGQRDFLSAAQPGPAAGTLWATTWLRRVREVLDGVLEVDDLRTLDRLLIGDDPKALLYQDLCLRAGRTVWLARRP
jgi:SAM-dependent methyltransferase